MSEQQLWPPIADLRMAIKWLYKGPDPPLLTGEKREDGTNLATHRMIGDRFQGKSALLEFLFAKYVTSKDCPASGYDFYSARDNEALAALKKNCPYREQIILVHGPKVKLKSNFPSICMNDLDPRKTKPGQVFITCNNFYLSEEEKYASLLRFTKILELRADEWDHVSVFAIREAQEYINSQMRTNQARTQKEAAEDFVRFHNEAYHSGVSVILDSQRDIAVSKDVRELNTYKYYKNLGDQEIPKKIRWIMSPETANFDLGAFSEMSQDQFVIMTRTKAVGQGTFTKPPWHHIRGQNLLRMFDITVMDEQNKEVEWKDNLIKQEEAQGKRGRPSLISPEVEKLIESMQGKKYMEIYAEAVKLGYKGSARTLREHQMMMKLKSRE